MVFGMAQANLSFMQEKPENLPDQSAKMQDWNWDDLRVFLALGRAGSYAEASRRLGINESTVVRRLQRLTERLQARLFERAGGRLMPTAAGAGLLEAAEAAEASLLKGQAAVTGQDRSVAGLLRITAVPILANRLLVPALPSLLGQHPDLEVEIIAEPSALSVMRREVDIALRLARPRDDPQAITRKVGDLAYHPCCALGRDPTSLPWVTYGAAMAALPQAHWIARKVDETGETVSGLKVNDAEALLQAVEAGLGKALLPASLLTGTVGLQVCGPQALTREVWTLVHPDLKDLARIRRARDWIARLFAKASNHAP